MSRMKKHTGTHSWVSASERRATSDERRFFGSALILVVVLTSLLAIIGVVFLLSSRVDSIATSAISENKELNLAVDTVIAAISQELASDVPGVTGQEYYDYPDPCNPFLSCLEPYYDGANYRWRHITDIYDRFGLNATIPAQIAPEYQNRALIRDSNPVNGLFPADADGDGVTDSVWVEIIGISSNKAKPIFAAVRVIDNGGMLNANTGFKFDPCDTVQQNIDGSSQLQINVLALAGRPVYTAADENNLKTNRANTAYGLNPDDLTQYADKVIWQYGEPNGPYTPFDISDELELRNRYLLDHEDIDTRLDTWGGEFRASSVHSVPFDTNIPEWFRNASDSGSLGSDYAYRHIVTTYNYDRIINPTGEKMFNVNSAANPAINKTDVYRVIRQSLDSNVPDASARQITANLIDYLDGDSQITVFVDPNDPNSKPYYGFETPCIYISELAHRFVKPADPNAPAAKSFAIELYKPYTTDPTPEPNKWCLSINNPDGSSSTIPINWIGNSDFYVVWNTDVNAPLDINTADSNVVTNTDVNFVERSHIELQIEVDPNLPPLTVDWVDVPAANTKWLIVFDANDINERTHSYQRDIGPGKCIRRLWDISFGEVDSPTLGGPNPFSVNTYAIQEHPANATFTNIGEIGMLFRVDGYLIGSAETEADVRLDLQEPAFQQIFKYLTVIDPASHVADPNETRIKGRININTAPWFVLAQLPWVSQRIGQGDDDNLARSIVAYRDRTAVPGLVDYSAHSGTPGFKTIGELMDVNLVAPADPYSSILSYENDGINNDLQTLPDLTPKDGAANDFEERDVIFARISNLVTVRSDVFTAYILVRIGQDGPQKRVIAILDRSEVKSPTDKVKVLAVHPVPDPR